MISVVVIAKNEEDRIKTCLDSLQFADEVVVVDDNSDDETVSVAKAKGTKVVSNYFSVTAPEEPHDFSKIRNIGLEETKGDWILYVDADERVLAPLREEIRKVINSQTNIGAFAIPRKNIILGEEKKYATFWPDYVIRLFPRKHLKKWEGRIHEQPVFSGDLGKLKNPLLHLTHRDIDSMVLKSLDWANTDARLRLEANHPSMTGWRFLRIFFTEIINQGITRRGFFNGTVGVVDSLLQVFSMYLSYVKLWQLQRDKSLEETYDKIDKKLLKDKFNYP